MTEMQKVSNRAEQKINISGQQKNTRHHVIPDVESAPPNSEDTYSMPEWRKEYERKEYFRHELGIENSLYTSYGLSEIEHD